MQLLNKLLPRQKVIKVNNPKTGITSYWKILQEFPDGMRFQMPVPEEELEDLLKN